MLKLSQRRLKIIRSEKVPDALYMDTRPSVTLFAMNVGESRCVWSRGTYGGFAALHSCTYCGRQSAMFVGRSDDHCGPLPVVGEGADVEMRCSPCDPIRYGFMTEGIRTHPLPIRLTAFNVRDAAGLQPMQERGRLSPWYTERHHCRWRHRRKCTRCNIRVCSRLSRSPGSHTQLLLVWSHCTVT
jgi:hypothetical protein